MKKIMYLSIIIIALLTISCATINKSYKKNAILPENECYIVGNFESFTHILTFENLETGERLKLSFYPSNDASLAAIPEGKYAIVVLFGKGLTRSYKIDIPHELMKLIEVKPGKAIYIGDFTYEKMFLMNIGTVNHYFNITNVRTELENKYQIDFPLEVISLDEL